MHVSSRLRRIRRVKLNVKSKKYKLEKSKKRGLKARFVISRGKVENKIVAMEEKLDDILRKLSKLEATVEYMNTKLESIENNQKSRSTSSRSNDNDSPMIFELYKKGVKVVGNTHPYKSKLKEYNARWNPGLKAWIMTRHYASKAVKDLKSELSDMLEAPKELFDMELVEE